ncbi:MAG: dependent oxidoreductase [Chloroflexi bacterium]|nr:dependent oxidoreductase [Chloroflexota bacterium]
MPIPNASLSRHKPAAAMVIGGGIGGMRAALDLADAGLKVYLIEQTPCLGGRVAQLGYMFPQHDCVLCRGTSDHGYGCTRPSISPAYIQQNQHPNIEILTSTRLIDVVGQAGDFTVLLRQEPRYIDYTRCINCGYCANVCPVELPDEYQRGMTLRKAAYKVSTRAAPDSYVIDRGPYCDDCRRCVEVCPSHAVDLDEQPRLVTVEVGAVILALGFQVYNPEEMDELGFQRYPNVVHAMQYERLASRSGPTEGIVMRPSDHMRPASIAWLQCIGSRDQRNSYCSSICCMYATKEAILAKQRLGNDVDCSVFIMDERAFNKEYSTYFAKARQDHGIKYVHCRVSAVREDPHTHNLILQYADQNGQVYEKNFEMVVLATGLKPPETARQIAQTLGIELNQYGFCQTDKFTPLQTTRPGVFVCGAFSSPKEIVETIIDASGAAAEVMRLLNDRLNTHTFTRQWPFLSEDNLPEELDISGTEPRVGVFVCNCGGTLNQVLDTTQLRYEASKFPGVVSSYEVDFACFPETLKDIQRISRQENLNRSVIAACSNRTHDSLFQKAIRQIGLNPYLLELVNLREQCSMPHHWQPALANRKASEMIRTAVGRVSLAEPVHKDKHRCRSVALVIGGGVAGMTAALAIADSGYDVHLVERTDALGGNLLRIHYVAEGYNPQRLLRDLVNRVRSHQRIYVYTNSEVVGQSGHIGFFQTDVCTRHPGGVVETIHLEHGVTIVATGGREGRGHSWLGYPGVITQRELEEKIIHHPEEIAEYKNVVMIQCIRPENGSVHVDYCSRVCCTNTMKNAIRLKLYNPSCQVSVLYKNIITYGFREEYYTEARRRGVIFIRYTDENPPQLIYDQDYDRMTVKALDLSLNCWLSLPTDVVPLSMSILPADGTPELAHLLRVPLSSEGFFEEAQLKLRPMDFMREGIFLAGMAHYPKFIEESISHALAAAARALTLLAWDSLYLGGVVAKVDPDRCVGCLTCTRTCPFGIPQVIQMEDRPGVGGIGGAAYIDAALCQGCGTCTGECPANAIQLVHYTDAQLMMRNIGGLGQWLPKHRDFVPGLSN